jgi:hypothetical protein
MCIHRTKLRQCGKIKLNKWYKLKKKHQNEEIGRKKWRRKVVWRNGRHCVECFSHKGPILTSLTLNIFPHALYVSSEEKATVWYAILVPIYQTTRCRFPKDRKRFTCFYQKLHSSYLSLLFLLLPLLSSSPSVFTTYLFHFFQIGTLCLNP